MVTRLAGEGGDGPLQRRLHRGLRVLDLEAAIGAAVILHGEAIARHQASRVPLWIGNPRRKVAASWAPLPSRWDLQQAPPPPRRRRRAGRRPAPSPGAPFPSASRESRALDPHRPAIVVRPRPGPGTRRRGRATGRGYAGPHSAAGRPPVDPRLVGLDLAGIGDAVRRLGGLLRGAALQGRQRPRQEVGAEGGQPRRQRPRRVVRRDRRGLGQQDRAFIEALAHPHHLHPGLAVAGHDRSLDRRRAPPARQQRSMQVEGAQAAAPPALGAAGSGRRRPPPPPPGHSAAESGDLGGIAHRSRRADGQAEAFGEGLDRPRA